MKVSLAMMVLVALLAAGPGQAANPAPGLPAAAPNYAEQPSYPVPASFPGPIEPQPRRKPEPSGMLLCCLGLIVYLARRRSKALAAAAA